MLDRLKALLSDRPDRAGAAGGAGGSESDLHRAAAALLAEAAIMDGSIDAGERQAIAASLAQRFGLPQAEAVAMVARASEAASEHVEIYGMARQLKDGLDHDGRLALIEDLWEVVYADGELHDHEASLMRRVAGLLYVSDQESGAVRKRVLSRLGVED
ncbi:MAG: TerB family tellurite resistance protein [Tistlia sp.]|uniref:tellurite resistance TerB family protein n=1 Tax=Tistlia sp. TaxID=3057121 RepID=UPI0034A28143